MIGWDALCGLARENVVSAICRVLWDINFKVRFIIQLTKNVTVIRW